MHGWLAMIAGRWCPVSKKICWPPHSWGECL